MIAVVPAREVAPEFTAAAAGAEDCQVAECACDQCRTLCHCDFCPVLVAAVESALAAAA
jgi:hypothetical protein